ncbi:hypothetical protein L6164_030834 [Bauhinia variegata]|uniref:Uncharacterized protein n=1 Tax=Bauhinia variegata TaxID=167791 RepID=A0ACB9LDK0_BAUVA|nr:hypothetical protein L6164_030834 [Bauhinia variegata]
MLRTISVVNQRPINRLKVSGMNIRLGLLLCSSISILKYLIDSIAQHFAAAESRENMLNSNQDNVPTAANTAAQKHFRQIQHFRQA